MKERILGLYFNPPMAIARVGSAEEPVEAYRWEIAENPHRGLQTRIVPAPSLRGVPCDADEQDATAGIRGRATDSAVDETSWTLEVTLPRSISFKDGNGRIRPVAPFFELWAKVQDGETGETRGVRVTPALLRDADTELANLRFRATAANRKAEIRTKSAACGAIARVEFAGDDFRRHRLDAISPHTEGQVPLVPRGSPLPLGFLQCFRPGQPGTGHEAAHLDQLRLRFTPGSGDSFGPPDAIEAPASPLQPGAFAPPQTEDGPIHAMTRPQNRFLNAGTPWSGYNFRSGNTPKWPTPMDSYDGARVGSGNGWGLIDNTCDVLIEAELTAQGSIFKARARAFAGPPDFAPDRRPFYSIRDEVDDRELPVPAYNRQETPKVILDLFRRIFETSSLLNLDQRRAWALGGNAGLLGAADADDPDWDEGISPRLGPRSMRESDRPYAELTWAYTPDQSDTAAPTSGAYGRLLYTQVVQQVHARMADAPILEEFLARRPDRVRRLVRPPFAVLADLPRRVDATRTAAVPMRRYPDGVPIRWRDPRGVLDQLYDMRMPPFMRHSMGVPLSITRRHYLMLMAWLDAIEEQFEEAGHV